VLVAACRDIRLMENGCVEKKKDLVGWVQAEWQACRHECGIKKVRE
jgi:hypothetical protein